MSRLGALLSAVGSVVFATRNQTEGDYLVPREKVEELRGAALAFERAAMAPETSQPTGQTYEITTISDLVRIPDTEVMVRAVVNLTRALIYTRRLADLVADNADGVLGTSLVVPEPMTWTDDGIDGVDISIADGDEVLGTFSARRAEGGDQTSSLADAWLPIDQAPRDGTKVWLWIVMPAEGALLPNEDGTFGWGEPDVGRWNEALLQWEHSIAGNPTHFMHVVPPTAPLENTNVR